MPNPFTPPCLPAAPPWVCSAQQPAAVAVGCAPAVKPADLGQGSSSSASSSSSSASSSSSSSSASALPGNSKNTGEVKLEKYDTSAGEHQPATRTEKPKNVPKPLLSDKANEKTIDGLYENIAYIAASMQYLFQTGDMEPFEKCALVSSEKSSLSSNTECFRDAQNDQRGQCLAGQPDRCVLAEHLHPEQQRQSLTPGAAR